MKINNNEFVDNQAITNNLKRITNQIYKLLPHREECLDWHLPLDTIIEELAGMLKLLPQFHQEIFSILCKLEGLHFLCEEDSFHLYRRSIFECLNATNELGNKVLEWED